MNQILKYVRNLKPIKLPRKAWFPKLKKNLLSEAELEPNKADDSLNISSTQEGNKTVRVCFINI